MNRKRSDMRKQRHYELIRTNGYRKSNMISTGENKSRWVKKLRVYPISAIQSLQGHAESLLSTTVPIWLTSRVLKQPRTISEWSEKVRETSDEKTKIFKALLNKLARSNFLRIQEQLLSELTQDTSACFSQLLLDKAVQEFKFGEIYADLCKGILENRPYFKREFLTACQVAFEDAKERKTLLNCVNFVGQLFNSRAIPPKVIRNCCDLLVHKGNEDSFEALCHLLGSCNWVFSHSKMKQMAHQILGMLNGKKDEFSSCTRFKIMDLQEVQSLRVLNKPVF